MKSEQMHCRLKGKLVIPPGLNIVAVVWDDVHNSVKKSKQDFIIEKLHFILLKGNTQQS